MPKTATRITAVYLRVSTALQETRQQDEKCFEYLAFKNDQYPSFENPATYEDADTSGSTAFAKRRGGAQLIQAVQRLEVAHIVVAKLDRLGRSAEDVFRIFRICEEHGTTIHIVDLGGDSISTGGASGKLLVSIMAVFAEFERNMICERITDRMESKRRNRTISGSWGEVCGTVPYGWEAVATTRKSKGGKTVHELVLHEKESVVLRQLIKFRYGQTPKVDGKQIIGNLPSHAPSYAHLAAWLNSMRIPNKSGGQWSAGSASHVLNNSYTRALIQHDAETKNETAPSFVNR